MAPSTAARKTMSIILREVLLRLPGFSMELSVEISGPIAVLFGPSGAGKTSLLDLIAGLGRAKSAFIAVDNVVLADTNGGVFVPTRLRKIGYVPQDLALFPHLSARQNLL